MYIPDRPDGLLPVVPGTVVGVVDEKVRTTLTTVVLSYLRGRVVVR